MSIPNFVHQKYNIHIIYNNSLKSLYKRDYTAFFKLQFVEFYKNPTHLQV